MTRVHISQFSLLKLHNVSITLKMVVKVIINLDSSNAPGSDCIPMVVLKNCELEQFKFCFQFVSDKRLLLMKM